MIKKLRAWINSKSKEYDTILDSLKEKEYNKAFVRLKKLAKEEAREKQINEL